jgi:putative membrane protein
MTTNLTHIESATASNSELAATESLTSSTSGAAAPPAAETPSPDKPDTLFGWVLRAVKGMFIGTGAILPGVSGGALAAVFGIYERMINFLANPKKDFVKNTLWFIPVALGAVLGMFGLAFPLDYFLKNHPVQVVFFFIGAIAGTFPALIAEAGKQGRSLKHWVETLLVGVAMLVFLIWARNNLDVNLPLNFATWVMAGVIFALGMIVPGLSPSNFLMYFNMYQPMTEGIKNLNFSILIPVGIGAVLCVLAFAKLMHLLLERAYTSVFHFILGVVLASTAIILPWGSAYDNLTLPGYLVTALLAAAGVALGLWMGWLEKKYQSE